MNESRWESVTRREFTAFAVGAALFFILLARCEPGFVVPLDFANLLFHEAGHPIYGILSERLAVYGGTMGQLTFPAILIVSFWRKGKAVSFGACVIWFFENFLNIARYMADSRELVLPLVGGGEHDWNDIFFRWNVLSYDHEIATVTRALGWIGILAGIGFVVWRGVIGLKQPLNFSDESPPKVFMHN
jgi:hypothetical protein